MKSYSFALIVLTVLAAAPAATADPISYDVSFTFMSAPNPNGTYVFATGTIQGNNNASDLPPGAFYDFGDIFITSNDPQLITGFAQTGPDGDFACFAPGTSPNGPTVTGNECSPPFVPGTFNFEFFGKTNGSVDVWIFPTSGNLGVNGTNEFDFYEFDGVANYNLYPGTLTISGDIDGIDFTPEPPSFFLLGTGLIGLAALFFRRARRSQGATNQNLGC